MNKETLIRTIVALIVAIVDLLAAFGIDVNLSQEAVLAAVTLAVGFWVYWKDNCHNKISAKFTDKKRLAIADAKKGDMTAFDEMRGGHYDD